MLTMNRMGAGSWCDIVEEEVRMGVAADIFWEFCVVESVLGIL